MISLSALVLLGTLQAQQEEKQPPAQAGANVFNPAITVFANALWRLDNKDVLEVEEDGTVIAKDDKFLLRETEADLRASIDPYADGVLIIALEQEAPGDFEVGVEEGYALIKSLPWDFWEDPPLATKIKIGRFLTALGRHNRLHTHDLPQSQRGLAFENFVGEHSYAANGASTESLLPSFGDSAFTLTLEALQGGGWKLGEDGPDRPAYLAHLSWFNTFADEHNVELGVLGHYGSNDAEGRRQTHLYSAELLYRWKPLRQGEWNSVVVSGQVFYGAQEFDPDPLAGTPSGTNRAWGAFGYAQYQLDRRWYLGVRYDWTELLENRDDVAQRLAPYITCYVTEFFRLRAGYEHTWSDADELDGLKTFLLELNVVFGAHPPHPYWVSQ